MHQRKYFTLKFFINEIFSAEKFPNYGIFVVCMYILYSGNFWENIN